MPSPWSAPLPRRAARCVQRAGGQGTWPVFEFGGEGGGLCAEGMASLSSATCVVSTVPPPRDACGPALSGFCDPVLSALAAHLGPCPMAWAACPPPPATPEGAPGGPAPPEDPPPPPPAPARAPVCRAPGTRPVLVYLSSTGVYGDHGGAWVDEGSEARAADPAQAARLQCERDWLHEGRRSGGIPFVLRLGGIYGPGRSALDAAARAGGGAPSQRRRARQRYQARVHVADICRAVEALVGLAAGAEQGGAGEEGRAGAAPPVPEGVFSLARGGVMNVVDCDPAPRDSAVRFARGLLGLAAAGDGGDGAGGGEKRGEADEQRPAAPGAAPGGGGGAGPRARGEKRVSNRLLLWVLSRAGGEGGPGGARGMRYPSFREGLSAVLDAERGAGGGGGAAA